MCKLIYAGIVPPTSSEQPLPMSLPPTSMAGSGSAQPPTSSSSSGGDGNPSAGGDFPSSGETFGDTQQSQSQQGNEEFSMLPGRKKD